MSLASAFSDSLDPFRTQESFAAANAALDWKETEHAHVFKVDLPGLSKDQVRLEVIDARILQIGGERKDEEDGCREVVLHRVERSSGRFLRRLRLPEDANAEEVKAKMEDGVLTVTVKKIEEEKKKKKKVKVRSVEVGGGKGGKSKKGAGLCCGVGF